MSNLTFAELQQEVERIKMGVVAANRTQLDIHTRNEVTHDREYVFVVLLIWSFLWCQHRNVLSTFGILMGVMCILRSLFA